MNSICCSAQACMGFLCGSCFTKLKSGTVQHAKLAYILFYAVVGFFGILVVALAPVITDKIQHFGLVVCDEGDTRCFSNSATHRVSFTLGVFHLTMMVFSLVGGQLGSLMHRGCWAMKVLLGAAIFVLSFYIPNSLFVRSYAGLLLYIFTAGGNCVFAG